MYEFGLIEEHLGEQQMYLRYLKFKEVTFPEVPRAEWHRYYNDLLEFEPYLVWGGSIGCCEEYPFHFEVDAKTPIRMKPTPLAKPAREWVRNYMA